MSFLKSLLASILGVFIAFTLFLLIVIGVVASSSSESEPFVRDGSVLNIPLSGMIGERRTDDPFMDIFDPAAANRVTMDRFRSNIRKAKSDSRVAGIRLDLAGVGGSWAHLSEMRELLLDFKSEGKFIYAFIDDRGANEAGYFIATAADSIFAQPETYLEMDGFYIQGQFLKNTFDKYGVEVDVITTGTYKTAASNFVEEQFTASDREQLGEIMQQFSDTFVSAVSEYTGMDSETINGIMNGMPNILVSNALERGFIDGIIYESEFKELLKERTGNSTLRDVSFGRYARVSPSKAGVDVPRNAKEIAIIYAEGPIMPDFGSDIFSSGGNLTYNSMKKAFDEVLEDDNVAAIVVRINSPGGAVTTSEAIRNLFIEAAEKKPVIASMGTVAASGGYYIAMGADTVLAEANTITGSIGVVLMKLSYGNALEENFGVTHDEIKTHQNANWFSPVRSLSPEQRRAMENIADETYTSFLQLVADARGQERDEIHRVAQGRVWTGTAALELGLIDAIGSLPDAVRLAAEIAELDEYIIGTYPKEKTLLESLMESGNVRATQITRRALGIAPSIDKILNDLNVMSRPQVFSIIETDFSVN